MGLPRKYALIVSSYYGLNYTDLPNKQQELCEQFLEKRKFLKASSVLLPIKPALWCLVHVGEGLLIQKDIIFI